jgi:hypothetical protein
MFESNVTFRSGELALAGTFARPDGSGPFPTALLLAGSGPIDRDGNHKRIKLSLSHDLAQMLADVGWASLRYDKRGVAESDGDYLSTGFLDELADAEAARDWLLARDDVAMLIAVGHSAGSLHSVELAGRPGISGAVLLATSAQTGEETLRWQARQIGEHIVPRPIKALLRLFRTSVLKQQEKAIAKLKATTGDTARIQLAKVNAKWMREFMAYDPVPALRATSVPLLAITGSKDVQVDPADLAIVADVAHIMRPEDGPISNPRSYGKQAAKPIDPRVVHAILGWLGPLRTAEGTGMASTHQGTGSV